MSNFGNAIKRIFNPSDSDEMVATEEDVKEVPMSRKDKVAEEAIEGAVSGVKETVKAAVEEAVKEAIAEAKGTVIEAVEEVLDDAEVLAKTVKSETKKSDSREAKPHAFVVMPFGKKEGFDGTVIDFNAIYQDLIKPALEEAGFEPFRADEETTTGDILTDMFQ